MERRRKVTIVQSDLKGSTSLGERLDPESLREVLTLYFDEMRAVLEAHGGTIEKIIGDAIIAVFGLPRARPDDALRAVAAAAETQRTLATLNARLEGTWGVRLTNRTGVASGMVVVGVSGTGDHVLTGRAMQLAAALEQAAPAMEILISEATRAAAGEALAVEPAPPVQPKGAPRPVPAWLVGSVAAGPVSGAVASGASAEPDASGGASTASEGPSAPSSARFKAVQESRKTVTLVFTDVRATTAAGQPLAAEALKATMVEAFESARLVLERHGGTVEKFIGDAIMAVFGLPVRHEDDGLRAVRAAYESQTALRDLAERLAKADGIRLVSATGVNSGEVVAGDASLGQRLVTGDAVNVAARLEQAAAPYEVLIGALTYGLVREQVTVEPVEPLSLKGKAEPVPAYRLVEVGSASGPVRRRDTPMVGRERELGVLTSAFTEATADRRCRMVTVIGEAGVGKSRLLGEFIDGLADQALILSGRCLAYGEAITFWPIVELVRRAAAVADDDPPEVGRRKLAGLLGPGDGDIVERVAAAAGLSQAPFQLAELFWGIRRFTERLAEQRPVLILFDDIHWAESTFLDLVSHLVDDIQGSPVLLVCTARHALLEDHPDWAGREHEARLELSPLTAADARLVVEHLLGTAGLADEVCERIVTAAEGNPLFVEQFLSMLIDSGVLRAEGERWVASGDLARLDIPPSIHALLAARLDGLPAAERSVVEPASVIGLSFAEAAVRELLPEPIRPGLTDHLTALEQKQLVRAGQAASETDPGYRFQHILIRDAAYQGLLKRARAAYHERFVAWADRVNAEAGRAQEFEEILGYHLEQAYRYLGELGTLDAHAVDLGLRASERLSSAGRRAFDRGDMPAAANLLERATSIVPADHPSRPRLELRLGETRFEMGEYEPADGLLEGAAETATALGETALATHARLVRLLIKYLTDPTSVPGVAEEVEQAIPALEAAGDQAGLVTAWRFVVNLRSADAQWSASEAAADQWIQHARLGGDRVMEIRAGTALALAALFGPTPVPLAVERCRALLARSHEDRRSEALIGRDLAHLYAMQGEFALARDGYRKARRTLDELGWTFQASLTSLDSGPIELLAGDPAAAEAELRRDYETLDRLNERNYISTVAAILAEAVFRQARPDEAEHYTTFSAEIAAPDDLTTQFLWRQVRGKLLAAAGRAEDGVTVLREALELTRRSDEPIAPANVLLDLAEVLCLAGRLDEAYGATDEAISLYETKGNVVSAAKARAFRGGLAGSGLAGPGLS